MQLDGKQVYGLEAKFDDNLGYAPLRVIDRVPLPDEYPLIVGDAIHNLRSALDHAAWQMVPDSFKATTDENRLRYIAFPISRAVTDKDWAGMVTNALPSTTDEQRAIVKRHQAFNSPLAPGQWHPLAGLRDLDDMDKHRLTVFPEIQSTDVRFNHATLRNFDILRVEIFPNTVIDEGTEIGRVHGRRIGAKDLTYMQVQLAGTARVVFPDGGLVDERWRQMRMKVGTIIDDIERTL